MPDSRGTEKSVIKRKDKNKNDNQPSGINYLLAIAIDDYQFCPTLYNCRKDANKLIEVLVNQYGFENQHVTKLYNEEATEGNIIKAFRKLAQNLTERDNLIIYFSGHGEYDSVFDEGYWIPVNAKLGAQEDFLSNSDLRKRMNAIKSKHTFLVADSCFSGSLFAHYKSAAIADRLEELPSRWGLTAGRNEVVLDGKAGDHSPFAESLIFHLEKNKKPLGVAELCHKVIENVVANADQTPRGEPLKVNGHKGGQFFFHPKSIEKEEVITTNRGKILYAIPDQMVLNQDTKCLIRIAFDKEKLLEDLDITEATNIKSIRISNLMEAEIIDPLDADNFKIRSINQKEQFIDKDDFTQWIFYVKALKEGKFNLLIKVTVIEMIYGKERRREIVLEEPVEVLAVLNQPLNVAFKNAGYAIALEARDSGAFIGVEGTSKLEEVKEPEVLNKPDLISKPPLPLPGGSSGKGKKTPSGNESTSFGGGSNSGNIFKRAGTIAAAFLLLIFGGNIFMSEFGPKTGAKETRPKPQPAEQQQIILIPKYNAAGKGGYVDKISGQVIIPYEYDEVFRFREDVAFVKKGTKYGLIDENGKEVFPFIINKISKFENGVAKVIIRDRNFELNTEGKVLRNGKWVRLFKK